MHWDRLLASTGTVFKYVLLYLSQQCFLMPPVKFHRAGGRRD
jgi:hypothetical protein